MMAFEVAGRWSEESVTFLQMLARHAASGVPRLLRRTAHLYFFQRWIGLLACEVQRAYAASLLEEPLARSSCVNGPQVLLSDVDRLM